MKKTNKYLVFVGAALCLASCDLDKLPEGQYVGDGQNEEIIVSVRIWLWQVSMRWLRN